MSSRGIELRWSGATKTAKPVESPTILDEGNNAGGGGTGASGGAPLPDLP